MSADMLTIQMEHYGVSYLSCRPYLQFFVREKNIKLNADMLTIQLSQLSCVETASQRVLSPIYFQLPLQLTPGSKTHLQFPDNAAFPS